MMHLYDRAEMARVLTLDLDPILHRLLTKRIAALGEELIDWTEILVIGADDSEDDITSAVGISPTIEPIDGARFGTSAFYPHWDWLITHAGYWELQFTFGSTFCYIILVPDADDIMPGLVQLCRRYASGGS
jgi:hypothetical protein